MVLSVLLAGAALCVPSRASAVGADLVPQNISVSPNPASPGGTITVSWTLANVGTATASASNTVVRIETSASCPVVSQAQVSTASIGAGASISQSTTRTVPASGSYYVCVIADNNNTSGQPSANAGNDIQVAGPFSVQGAPDLVVSNISVNPDPASPGAGITVSWTLANQGTGTAAASTTVVRVETSASCPVVSQAQVSAGTIAAGSSLSQSTSRTAPSSGSYYVCVIADNFGTSGQSSAAAGNDIQIAGPFSVQAASPPDLRIQGVSISPNPAAPGAGITVSWTLANQGAGAASSSTTAVRVQSSASCPVVPQAEVATSSLGAGASISQSAARTAPGAGTFYICVIADNYGTSGQSSAGAANDIVIAGPYSVSAASSPDLVVQAISVSPTNPTPGGAITVSWTLRNQGNATASASTTAVRVQSSNSCPVVSQAEVSAVSLTAGQSISQSATRTAPLSGPYYICVLADNHGTSGQSAASDDNDITIAGPFSIVTGAADLVPQGVGVSPSPVAPGAPLTVTWTLRNQGTAAAAASNTGVRVLASNGSATCTGQTIANVPASGLSVNATTPQATTVSAPMTPGTYYACVIADNTPGSPAQGGANTGNDFQYSTAFTVQGATAAVADLVVQGLQANPTSAQAGQQIALDFTMKNHGGSTAADSVTNLRISTSSSSVTVNDPLLASINVANLAAGETRRYTPTVTLPTSLAAGPYYLWAIADAYSATNQSAAQVGDDKTFIPFVVTGAVAPGSASLEFRNPLAPILEPKEFDYEVTTTVLNNSPAPSALSADGRSAVVVRFVSSLQNVPVTFTASSPGTLSPFYSSYLEQPAATGSRSASLTVTSSSPDGGRYVYLALLWPPENMPLNSGNPPSVNLIVSASQPGSLGASKTIKLYPPPLLLVHGIWSGALESGFQSGTGGFLDWMVGQYPHDFIYPADYYPFRNQSFRDDGVQRYFQQALILSLRKAARGGLAARQVDVVGHSMGGLVTRWYVSHPPAKSAGPPNAVHQLITIGTPHQGSELAKEFLAHLTSPLLPDARLMSLNCIIKDILPCTLGEVLADQGKAVDTGVKSLVPNNDDLKAIASLAASTPYRSIVGQAPNDSTRLPPISSTEIQLNLLIGSFIFGQNVSGILGTFAHDTIVSAASQRGEAIDFVPISERVVHTDIDPDNISETESLEVRKQAFTWLTGQTAKATGQVNRKAKSKSTGAPPNLDLTGYTEVDSSNVTFLPATGSTLTVGAPTTITATSATRTIAQIVLFQTVVEPSDTSMLYSTLSPFAIAFVPTRIGTARFAAFAMFTDMTYAALPLTYQLQPAGAPTLLTLSGAPSTAITVGSTSGVRSFATYASGIVDVSRLASYSVRSGTGNVFTVGIDGSITATGAGTDWLDVTYEGFTVSTEISVAQTVQPLATRLVNISTRGQSSVGDDVLIAGFIVGGTTPKTIVVNVAGPSLANYGVTNPLMNPTLTLVRSSDQSVVASNDDWGTQGVGTVSALVASGFQPNHPLEPALIGVLAPGAYTAIVQGAGGTTGLALVGVFEADHPEAPLINISTRGRVLTGETVMIAGFIIQGTAPQTVVVNVAGPSLAAYGINNSLANPTLTLVRSSDQAVIATNDDWQSQGASEVAALQATGFQPNHPLEPGLRVTLQPGAYTAIVQGANGGTGTGLVGVFAVP